MRGKSIINNNSLSETTKLIYVAENNDVRYRIVCPLQDSMSPRNQYQDTERSLAPRASLCIPLPHVSHCVYK